MYRQEHVLNHIGHKLWPGKSCLGKRAGNFLFPLSLCLLLSGALFLPALADTNEEAIAKLEIKFFSHDYRQEPIQARLDRLEKMVFGETKSGEPQKRISGLLAVVPGVNDKPAKQASDASADKAEASGGNPENASASAAPDNQSPSASKYPAVTAIEQRLFAKNFVSEPINQRLERLETKVFGKVSASDDLSYRVDRLKDRTGIDIAKQAPPGSDWVDEDSDQMGEPGQITPMADDDSGYNNSRRSLQRTFGTPPTSSSYPYFPGQGRLPAPNMASGSGYGSAPPLAPDYQNRRELGLNQEVTALEREIFGKTFTHEALPTRLSRLEQTVFPEQPPAQDMPLPLRVKKLLAVIPLSQPNPAIAQSRSPMPADDLDPDGLPNPYQAQAPSNYPSKQHSGGGLSKIIGSIGNLLTGGPMGGYSMPGGMIQDPQTGLLYNQATGTLIDPVTGAIVGQRATPYYGGGYAGFNNGFSPMMGGTGFGIGGSGIRFGMGGPGFGMWP